MLFDRSEPLLPTGTPELEHILPPIGTNTFFPALISHLRDIPSCPPLDPVVLQSILLCIIAGDKHLILRTHEEDVASVAKVAASVSASLPLYRCLSPVLPGNL